MSDLSGFAKLMRITAKSVIVKSDNLVADVVLAIDQAVVLATPVRTGRARANWRVSLEEMNNETRPTPDSPEQGAAQALVEGEQVVKKYRQGDDKKVVHITNSLPYIGKLNAGSSKQAPANFVHTATMLALKAIRNVKLLR
jgi:hypothetical protein